MNKILAMLKEGPDSDDWRVGVVCAATMVLGAFLTVGLLVCLVVYPIIVIPILGLIALGLLVYCVISYKPSK